MKNHILVWHFVRQDHLTKSETEYPYRQIVVRSVCCFVVVSTILVDRFWCALPQNAVEEEKTMLHT